VSFQLSVVQIHFAGVSAAARHGRRGADRRTGLPPARQQSLISAVSPTKRLHQAQQFSVINN
jgi:hypothetical protein